MGKLNIAHHKSYHPYRRDNIERVRRDEEEARLREAVEEGRMMLADSEARMDLLRQRAGLGGNKGKKTARGDDTDDLDLGGPGASSSSLVPAGAPEEAKTEVSTLTTANGHINFFEDLERTVIPVHGPGRSTKGPKGAAKAEDEKGVALAPSVKDLNPWYVKPGAKRNGEGDDAVEETDEEKRRRDLLRKSAHDPLTAINSQLAARDAPSSSSSPFASAQKHRRHALPPPPVPSRTPGDAKPEVAARLARESSERQRALELIARKKREAARGSETPSTVHGGDGGGGGGRYGGYGDVFNRMEMEEVRRERERKRDRERDRDRDREWERASGSGSGRDREDRRRYGGR
ncbi:hypothetical protein GY45DRAFT_876959 [Cubamyces sp. BRFM 1775]|nr:hypothetical protein GY45DRAFT_876959 [Cubamyces sp. BRFM 1775]